MSPASRTLVEPLSLDPAPLLAALEAEAGGLVLRASGAADSTAAELRARVDAELAPEGTLVLCVPGARGEAELAAWRDALWPLCHVGSVLERSGSGARRRTLHGADALDVPAELLLPALVAQRRTHVLAPKLTVEKFDGTAAGWNGFEGTPGYPHHRWMRRFVGHFGGTRGFRRILDFGSGAGWVGIEAALENPGCTLCLFDPSPAMVDIATRNASAAGIADCVGRTGFGEDPPFPAAGEAPFDLVLSSGVISFARDTEAWMEGLVRACAPGGTLIIGDLHPRSRGMRRRRASRALLPLREMNAKTREEVRAELERRGFVHERSSGYQLTTPIPQAMHFNETRLGGLLTWPLLAANKAGAGLDRALGSPLQDQFDSWVMRFRAPGA